MRLVGPELRVHDAHPDLGQEDAVLIEIAEELVEKQPLRISDAGAQVAVGTLAPGTTTSLVRNLVPVGGVATAAELGHWGGRAGDSRQRLHPREPGSPEMLTVH